VKLRILRAKTAFKMKKSRKPCSFFRKNTYKGWKRKNMTVSKSK